MSEEKHYYWLKLQETFFEDDTIDYIESQKNGEKYVLFYLKLCLKALKNEGKLIRYVGELLMPYDDVGIAKLTKTDIDTVRLALILFTNIGLIKKLDSGEIYLTQLNELIGSETAAAKRKRIQRLNQKALENRDNVISKCDNVTPMSQDSHTEFRDRDIDIDIELEFKDHTLEEQKCGFENVSKDNECTECVQMYEECTPNDSVPAYIQQPINQTEFKSLVNFMFETITKHNESETNKIPISKHLIYFEQKECSDIKHLLQQYNCSEIKSALENYLKVVKSDTWKKYFTWNDFIKKINEFLPEYFSLDKYLIKQNKQSGGHNNYSDLPDFLDSFEVRNE